MSRTRQRNLAARMGRWSAAHWKTALFGWLAFDAAAWAVGSAVGVVEADPNAAGPGESGRMNAILDEGFKQPATERVLVQSDSARVGDAAFTAAIEDVVSRLSALPAVEEVRSPLAPGNRDQIAGSGRAALVDFDIRGPKDEAGDKIDPVLAAVADAQRAHPGFFVGEFGDASAVHATDTLFADDLGRAGVFSLPITLVILVVAFGALVAAGIPLLLALTAVFATFGLSALPSHALPLAREAFAVVLLIGLAVGVDYAMFYLKRERQERAAGRSERGALEAAAATSGRSVLVSGLTVMVAMAGLFLTGDATFASFGYATIIVVAVAVLGSLTVLPALLAKLGDRVDRLHVPFVGRLRRDDGEGRIWGAIVDRVLRRPLLSAVLSGGLLLALAAPALQLRLATPSPEAQFPASLDIVKTYDRMQEAFPGSALPANVVVKAPDVNAPAVRDAIGRLQQKARESSELGEPITVAVNADATVANITVPIAGTGTDPASNTALTALREDIVPATVGAVAGVEAGVTGQTASWRDTGEQIKSWLAPVVAFVLVFAFGLMLVAFRSVVVAAKAILLNLLSVGAAYGVLVLVFQHGVGQGLLGFGETSGIEPVVPLLLFVILFGLSMDYHVFILSRIRETYDRGASMDEAVSHGIKSTAGVVTSAAVVMVAVFSVFATLSILFFKQFGVGLATAVLIDATLVRAVLLPATMKLLGERNWYLPRWLQWLPRLDEGAYEPVPEPVPAAESEVERKRGLTAGRVFGLVLIAAVAVGLAYLRFAPEDRVSVPAGATAGQLTLEPCEYATEGGSYAADCGTLVVPENRADRGSRLIALPVTRIHARSAHPAEPVFWLKGGPGLTNTQFPEASRVAENHDVVLVGYRGVDGSVRLDCPEVESALSHSRDLVGDRTANAYADGFRACADRLQDDGVDLAGYGIPQRVDDFEAARKALGYRKIDLLSESAGTRTAMVYAWRYPRSIHRSVMIAANPPGRFLWDPATTDEQIRRYAALCARDDSCAGRTDDLAASMRRTEIPDSWWGLPVKAGNVRAASFFGLMESTSENAPLAAPMTIDSWLAAGDGDASGFWFQSFAADLFFPQAFVWGEFAAFGRADADAARELLSRPRRDSILGDAATRFLWADGQLVDAWPAVADEDAYSRVRRSEVETLLVNGALDLAIPPQFATNELLPSLPNGEQVVLDGFGHTLDFWTYQPDASTRLLNAFFDSGKVDRSLYEPQRVDFTPEVTQGALGKGIAGAMAGLALLTVLSLLWAVRRVLKRGAFGRKASVTLRILYPVVLGLGGWFLGVLVAITTMPDVALADPLLATISIGVPIGLSVYLGWIGRDASVTARLAGFAAAGAAALGGAWLGFHSVAGLAALVTTIAGATAGTNLALILVDVARARAAGRRSAETARAPHSAPEAAAPAA